MGFTPTATANVTHTRASLCYQIEPPRDSCPCKADLVTTTLYWLKHQSEHHPTSPIWKNLAADCPLDCPLQTRVCSLPATSPTGERRALGILNSQAAKDPGSTICGEMTIIKVFSFTYQLLL